MDNQTGNLQLPFTGMPDLDPLRLRKAQMLAGLLRQPGAQSSDLMNQIGLSAPGMGQSADDGSLLLSYAGLDGSLANVDSTDTNDDQGGETQQAPQPALTVRQTLQAAPVIPAQLPVSVPAAARSQVDNSQPSVPLLDSDDLTHRLLENTGWLGGVSNAARGIALAAAKNETRQARWLLEQSGVSPERLKAFDEAVANQQNQYHPPSGPDWPTYLGNHIDPEKVLIGKAVADGVGDPIIGWMGTQMPANRAAVLGWLLKSGIRRGVGALF